MDRIDRLLVTNFQSVENADIEVGGFTVIVGPSNSGKSALVRALKAVSRNVNTPSAVRAGKSVFTAAVRAGDTTVSIERGKSQSTYRVSSYSDGSEEVYTKAGRSVPEDIQKVLGLPVPEGPDLTFSGQIDPPFLLAETGTVVAKVLGDLTNVSKLHEAAKEANRRRLEASKMAKIRREDAIGAHARLKEEFSTLPADSKRVQEARAALDEVRTQAKTAEALRGLLSGLDVLDSAESDLQDRLSSLPEPADIEGQVAEAQKTLEEAQQVKAILQELAQLDSEEVNCTESIEVWGEKFIAFDREYVEVLHEAGSCPMCGQATEKVMVHG